MSVLSRIFSLSFALLFFATSCQGEDNFRKVAESFMDTPYGASLLEKSGEPMTVRLDSVDCMTFVESVLAARLLGELPDASSEEYVRTLEKIRYRNGHRDGYVSRLHYSTEWIDDNIKKGILKDVSQDYSSAYGRKNINFMSRHHKLYPMIMEDTSVVSRLVEIEKRISLLSYPFISKDRVQEIAGSLEDGDIVMFMTDIECLDISHMGFVYFIDGTARLLHASSKYKKVCIDPKTLANYVKQSTHCTGIRVMRINLK